MSNPRFDVQAPPNPTSGVVSLGSDPSTSPPTLRPLKVGADGTVAVSGSVTVPGSVTADTELPAAAALGDTDPNPTAPAVGAHLMGYDASAAHWERVRVSANRLNVAVQNTPTVDTELPAAVAASDALANPTAPSVLSHALGWTGAVWERLKSAAGGLFVNLRNSSGTEIGVAGSPVRVDPTGTTTQPVSGTVTTVTTIIGGTVTSNAGTGTRIVAIQKAGGAANLTNAAVNATASGDNTVVSAVGGQAVYLYRLLVVAEGTVAVTLKSTAGTLFSGAMALRTGGSVVLDFSGEPWVQTASGDGLVLNLSAAVPVRGLLSYVQV